MNSSISTSDPDANAIYGSLIEVPKEPRRIFLTTFLVGVFVILFGTEIIHRFAPFHRHELDMQMSELAKLRGNDYRLLIMGDSVTRTPFWGVETIDDVYMLSTSATVNPLGNELIARRFYDQKNKSEDVVFVLSPILLRDSFKSRFFPTHFESIFTSIKEQNIVAKRLGYDPYSQTGRLNRRLKSINAFYHKLPGVQKSERHVVAKALLSPPFNQHAGGRSKKRLEALRKITNKNPFGITDENIQFFTDYLKYVREQGSHVTVVIPPMMEETSQLFLDYKIGAALRELEAENAIKLINVNSSQTYPPEAFWDGTHLNPFWQDIYLHQLETIFGPILAKEGVVGREELTPPHTFEIPDFYYRSGKTFTHNGETGLISNQLDVPFYVSKTDFYCLSARVVAKDGYSDSFHVSINLAEEKVWHLMNHSDEWQWISQESALKLPSGLNLIRFRERENTPLSAVKIEKCSRNK